MDEKELKELFEKANKEVKELRETLEKKSLTDSERAEKVARLEASLAEYEKINKDITLKMAEESKSATELKEKITAMEKLLSRPDLSGRGKDDKSAEYKAFEQFAKLGREQMMPEERKYLRTDSNVEGGFLAPPEYVQEIIKMITELTPARAITRVRRTSMGYIKIPTRTSILTASRPGQGVVTAEQNSRYGEEQIFAPRMTAVVPITVEMINDAAFNMESEINQDVAEAFAKKEGQEFLTGLGLNDMEGILTNASVATYNSGIAASYNADNIITICGRLKTGYSPMFGVNRFEIAYLRSLKDATGNYLWQTGIAAGKPNTLNGYPYVEMPDLDSKGANLYPIIFGDFYRGYTMVDGIVMTVVRDPYTLADSGKIRFIFYKGLGGKVTLAEAMIKLRCHV